MKCLSIPFVSSWTASISIEQKIEESNRYGGGGGGGYYIWELREETRNIRNKK